MPSTAPSLAQRCRSGAVHHIREGWARVFVAVDHCSGECVGNHAARSGNRFEALEPIRQGVLRHFGRIEKNAAKGLSLRHDHGSNYMAGHFQDEITFFFFGIESSPSFVRQPEGNGVAAVGAVLRPSLP
jgi:putative transposase